jgi:hypothetical protein
MTEARENYGIDFGKEDKTTYSVSVCINGTLKTIAVFDTTEELKEWIDKNIAWKEAHG